jgi:hypothetical protein
MARDGEGVIAGFEAEVDEDDIIKCMNVIYPSSKVSKYS